MLIGGVLDNQFDDHLQAQLASFLNKGNDILQLAEARIDLQVVADVVARIQKRGQVKGG
ncbi:hypothetical protein D3C75_1376310 [compost metagenome]